MPPIPVHIDDPITPRKQQGDVTAAPAGSPANNTTTTNQSSPSYPQARPGAPAVPAPTPFAAKPPPPPTRTQPTTQYDGPAPPQPGAVPIPPTQQTALYTATPTSLPPPPKAGEVASARASASANNPTTYPPQFTLPSPQQNQAATHSTSTTTTPLRTNASAPTNLAFGASPEPIPAAAQHPPGYQQNQYAQELGAAQRASLEGLRSNESSFGSGGIGSGFGVGGGSGSGSGGGGGEGTLGGLGAGIAGLGNNETVGQAWNTVKGWVAEAGSKVVEAEKEVWRRVGSK